MTFKRIMDGERVERVSVPFCRRVRDWGSKRNRQKITRESLFSVMRDSIGYPGVAMDLFIES